MNDDLSIRLFWQAGVTAVFAPFAATGGTGWVLLVLLFAAAAGGLGFSLRETEIPGRPLVIGFEVLSVLFGGLALLGDHYVPGSIVGAVTLVVALRSPAIDPEPTAPLSALIPVQTGSQLISYTPVAVGTAQAPRTTVPVLVGAGAPAGHAGVTLTAAPAVATSAPGRWAADPTRRNHYRWWDGAMWTEHVSTHGATGVDPLQ